MADPTAHFYSQPSYVGAGFPIFSGSRRQRGGNIFGALAKLVLPTAKAAGKAFVNRGIREGLGLAGDVGMAALTGRGKAGMMQTLKNRGLKRLGNAGKVAFGTAYNTFHDQHLPSAPKLPRPRPLPPPPPLPAPAVTRRRLGKRKSGTPVRVTTTAVKRRRRGGGATVANF